MNTITELKNELERINKTCFKLTYNDKCKFLEENGYTIIKNANTTNFHTIDSLAKDIVYNNTLVVQLYKDNNHVFYAIKTLNDNLLDDFSPRNAQRISINQGVCEIEFGNILMLRYISIEELIEQLPELKVELVKKAVKIENFNLSEFSSFKNHFKYVYIEGYTTYWWSDNLNCIINIGDKKLFV
jgi:hypothetical protein